MKTIIHQILEVFAQQNCHLIIDEMLDLLQKLTREQIVNNCQKALASKLIERRRDETTGLPSYKITTLGRSKLVEFEDGTKAQKKEIKAKTDIAQQPTELELEIKKLRELNQKISTDNEMLTASIHMKTLEIERLTEYKEELKAIINSANHHKQELIDSEGELQKEVDRLLAENTELKALNAELPKFKTDSQTFMIYDMDNQPSLFNDIEDARKTALSLAMNEAINEVPVYALVGAGKAVKTTEWRSV